MKESTKTIGAIALAAGSIIGGILIGEYSYNKEWHNYSIETSLSSTIVCPIGITSYAEYEKDKVNGSQVLKICNKFTKPLTCYDIDGDSSTDIILNNSFKSRLNNLSEVLVSENSHNKKLFEKADKILALFK